VPLKAALAIYFLIWWLSLFIVLPFGGHSQEQGGEIPAGTDPGAPAFPKIAAKLLWTTVVATVLFALCDVVYVYHLVTLDGFAALLGMK
jgi:predicted secreted protein